MRWHNTFPTGYLMARVLENVLSFFLSLLEDWLGAES